MDNVVALRISRERYRTIDAERLRCAEVILSQWELTNPSSWATRRALAQAIRQILCVPQGPSLSFSPHAAVIQARRRVREDDHPMCPLESYVEGYL